MTASFLENEILEQASVLRRLLGRGVEEARVSLYPYRSPRQL